MLLNEPSASVPPLRIHHFLAWMAASGLVGAWQQALQSRIAKSYPTIDTSETPLDVANSAIYVVTCGAMLTIVAFSLEWRGRSRIKRWEPGQWLALFGATFFVIHVVDVLLDWFTPPGAQGKYTGSVSMDLAYWSAWAIWFGVLVIRAGQVRSWRVAYFVLSVYCTALAVAGVLLLLADMGANIPGAVWPFFIALPVPAIVLQLLAVAVATVVDIRRGRRRSWAHWAGVGAWFAQEAPVTWW